MIAHPDSPMQVIFRDFRAQCRYYLYTWIPRVVLACCHWDELGANHSRGSQGCDMLGSKFLITRAVVFFACPCRPSLASAC